MKKEDILFNIITRTHNRPDLFKRCVDSIKNHRFKNIHHIVTYQNDKDLEYINKYKIKNTTVVPVPNIKKFKGDPTPRVERPHFGHRRYEYVNS